jgi:electron transport complex protein RnfG
MPMADDRKLPQIPVVVQSDNIGAGKMILTLAGIGLACGILIVSTYQWTFASIRENKARYLEQAIFQVLPDTEEKMTFTYTDDILTPAGEGERAGMKFYAGYNARHRLTGVAVEAEGQGFQDVVRILYGYSPACHCIVGMKVLESKETPGLGDKIETDEDFRANFDALDVTLDEAMDALANPIVLVKPRQKHHPWEIEAISGATISSRAVTNILHASTAVTIPIIENNLQVFEGGVM